MKNKKRNRREVFKSLKNPGDVIRIADRNEQIPTGADDLFCFVLPKPVEKEEAKALFQSLRIPCQQTILRVKASISRYFSNLCGSYKDPYQTKFVNKRLRKILMQKAYLLFAVGQSSDEIYSTNSILCPSKSSYYLRTYQRYRVFPLPFANRRCGHSETDYGYVGYVSFPWNRLSVDLSEIGLTY